MSEAWDTRMSEGRVICYPVAGNQSIYEAALMVADGAYVRAYDDQNPVKGVFVGIACDAVNTAGLASGEKKIRIIKTGAHNYKPATDVDPSLIGCKIYAAEEGYTVSVDRNAGPTVGYMLGVQENGTVRIRIDRAVC